MRIEDISHGQRVNWMVTHPAGYGYRTMAAAVVERFSPKRIRIRIAMKRRDGSWGTFSRSVKPENLCPREDFVAALDGTGAA